MQLQVKLFARARDLAGHDVVDVTVTDPATIADLRLALAERFPDLVPLISSLLVAVGTQYADDATILSSGDQIACFPPVSGG